MFNDRIDVREGNEQRKRTLAKVAAKMLANAGRAGGLARAGMVGGGLGRANAARGNLATRNLGQLARLHPQGTPGMGRGIGEFGMVDRMPGAFDPSINQIPDLGGADGMDPMFATQGDSGGGQIGVPMTTQDPGYQDTFQSAQGGDPEAAAKLSGQSDIDPFPSSFGGSNPQYVTWQGRTIPYNVYKALQATGELF